VNSNELERLASQLLIASGNIHKNEYASYGLTQVWSQKYEVPIFDNYDHSNQLMCYEELYDHSTNNYQLIQNIISGLHHNTMFIPQLTATQKVVLTLLVVSGLTQAETARALRISKSAITQHIKKIRIHATG